MAGVSHATHCPNCQGVLFREEKIVELDSSVVVREGLFIPARTLRELYRYVCIECNQILNQPWTGHHSEG